MYNKDERFKAIEKMRERESMFQERIMELKKINRQKGEDQKMAQKSKIEKVTFLSFFINNIIIVFEGEK